MIIEAIIVTERESNMVAFIVVGLDLCVVIDVVVEVTIMIKSLKLMLLLRETVIWFHS